MRGRVGRRYERNIVWMLGSPRSGTTWLMQMFGDHPGLATIDEPLIGAYLGPFTAELPGMDGAKLSADDFTLRRIQAGNPNQFFCDRYEDAWLPALGDMIRRRFAAQAGRRSTVVVKEPNGSQSADVLVRATPGSRLLFVLRDGRDVVDSETAGSGREGWVGSGFPGYRGIDPEDRLEFVAHSARKWLWRTSVVQEAFAAHCGPKLLLRYEDVLADPVGRMGEVLDWLGAPLPEDQLRALVERRAFDKVPLHARGPERFYRAASPGLWQLNLSAAEQDAMLAVIGPKLAELGYAGVPDNASVPAG